MTDSSTDGRVRVRYAPSPTGSPHIGNIRTALFNWLLARHSGGSFIVRIEDTDRNRLVPGAVENILGSLKWLGLDWDEGPDKEGPSGPYFQSERLPIYRQLADQLIAQGHAYRCYCTPERLEAVRAAQAARREPSRYDQACRNLTPEERQAHEAAGEPFVVRFKVPESGRTTFHDIFRGEISFDNASQDDFVMIKSDGWPTYQFASVVDDHLMGITHVLRGEEWISSTPKHVLEYAAFGWEPPLFGHFALILGKDRSKLSKRHGATDVLSYREMGYLPDALVNFLVLLGWSAPAEEGRDEKLEIYSREDLVRLFSLDRIGVTPSVFDNEKLDWMNGYYIRQMPVDQLAEALLPFLQKAGLVSDPASAEERNYVRAITPLVQERLKRLTEAPELIDFFFKSELDYDPQLLVQKGMMPESAKLALVISRERAETVAEFEEAPLEHLFRPLAAELGLKTSQLFGALRVALTGRNVAPPLFETMAVLGRQRSLDRLDRAIRLLGG